MMMKASSGTRISWNSKNATTEGGFFETAKGKSNAVRKGGACRNAGKRAIAKRWSCEINQKIVPVPEFMGEYSRNFGRL